MPTKKRRVPIGRAEAPDAGDVHECNDNSVFTVLKNVLNDATMRAKVAGIFCSEMKSCHIICLRAAVTANVVRRVW